jgi:hypothetical protein
MKKLILMALLAAAFGGLVCAQEQSGGIRDGRLSAYLNLQLAIMKFESKKYSDRDIRPASASSNFDYSDFNVGPTDKNFFEDANIAVGYETDKFGGRIAVNQGGLGGFRAWVSFIPQLKLSAGTDIDGSYADDLDADPGLRIYNGTTRSGWNDTIDPDNISSDEGLLLESFLGPVTIAGVATKNDVLSRVFKAKSNTNSTEGEVVLNREWQYGGRIASQLGDLGTVNLSYIAQYLSKANNYQYNANGDFVATAADAETYTHNFGLFASLKPAPELGLTLGWVGIAAVYLDQFYPTGGITEVDTLQPLVFKNGMNLNARYTGIPGFTLRTDHNYSFWTDKNYLVFGITGLGDVGLLSSASGKNYADVKHWLLWNGVGIFYDLNSQITVGIYARNLLRSDTVEAYSLTIDQIVIEPKVSLKFNANVEFYAKFNFEIQIDSMSKELNAQSSTAFIPGVQAVATQDVTQVFKIPLGVTIKL